MTFYQIEGINPTPWMAPKLGIGRAKRGPYPIAYPPDEMVVYKAAVQDYMAEKYPAAGVHVAGPHFLTFWYWRSLNFGGQRRKPCDVSNLNKCLEDALQGVLYVNDIDNRAVTGVMVEQGADVAPRILIRIESAVELPPLLQPPRALIG